MSFQNNAVLLLQLSLGHRIEVGGGGGDSYQLVLLMPICPSLPLAEELGAFLRILLCRILALFMARLGSTFLRYMKSMTTWSCAVQPLTVLSFSSLAFHVLVDLWFKKKNPFTKGVMGCQEGAELDVCVQSAICTQKRLFCLNFVFGLCIQFHCPVFHGMVPLVSN